MENYVMKCIYDRRSIRHFKDEKIDKDTLEKIVEAACQAPNGHNKQTWRFTVLTGKEIGKLKEEVRNTLTRTETDSLYGLDNPAALVIVTDRKENYNAMANGACAITTMLLSAWSLGIGGCWINALRTIQDEPVIRHLLNSYEIPENHLVVGMVVLGYIEDGELPKKPKRRSGIVHYISD